MPVLPRETFCGLRMRDRSKYSPKRLPGFASPIFLKFRAQGLSELVSVHEGEKRGRSQSLIGRRLYSVYSVTSQFKSSFSSLFSFFSPVSRLHVQNQNFLFTSNCSGAMIYHRPQAQGFFKDGRSPPTPSVWSLDGQREPGER